MSNKHHIVREDLDRMAEVARVSSQTETAVVWTELALYWREHATRPWVAVVEGKTNAPDRVDRFKAMAAGTVDRACNWFEGSSLTERLLSEVEMDLTLDGEPSMKIKNRARRLNAGPIPPLEPGVTLHRARDGEEEAIAAAVKDAIKDGVLEGATKVKARILDSFFKIRSVGITTDSIREAVTWLYPEDGLADAALARLVERDFAVPERTVRNALAAERDGKPVAGVWVAPFLVALRYFDRQLWKAGLETISNVEG
jgi:hypothetical protein